MKYSVKITGIGEMALDFLTENLLIIFNNNAPAELAEISVLHEIGQLNGEVVEGDKITIGKEEYIVTAVGSEANHTLRTMGHVSFRFDGDSSPMLPGAIHLKGENNPSILVGQHITIE